MFPLLDSLLERIPKEARIGMSDVCAVVTAQEEAEFQAKLAEACRSCVLDDIAIDDAKQKLESLIRFQEFWMTTCKPYFGLLWCATLELLKVLGASCPDFLVCDRTTQQYYLVLRNCVLGQGSFGRVYKGYGRSAQGPFLVAVKEVIPQGYDVELERMKRELEIHCRIKHPNVVHVYSADWFEIKNVRALRIVMEYCPVTLGTMINRFKDDPKRVEKAMIIFRKILFGYCELQSEHVIHRDLNPKNILLSSEDSLEPKIADFGMSREVDSDKSMDMTLRVGTPLYSAPEILFAHASGASSAFKVKYSSKSDIWSLGVILHEMLTGVTPYPRTVIVSVKILANYVEKHGVLLDKKLSESHILLLNNMLNRDPHSRISWAALYEAADVHQQITWSYFLRSSGLKSRVTFNEVTDYILRNGMLGDIAELQRSMERLQMQYQKDSDFWREKLAALQLKLDMQMEAETLLKAQLIDAAVKQEAAELRAHEVEIKLEDAVRDLRVKLDQQASSAQDASAALQKAASACDQLQQDVDSAERRAVDAERRTKDAERRVVDAERRAADIERRVAEAERLAAKAVADARCRIEDEERSRQAEHADEVYALREEVARLFLEAADSNIVHESELRVRYQCGRDDILAALINAGCDHINHLPPQAVGLRRPPANFGRIL